MFGLRGAEKRTKKSRVELVETSLCSPLFRWTISEFVQSYLREQLKIGIPIHWNKKISTALD